MTDEVTTPTAPFGRIALSLSGGGVRAVGFHLGTLDYLNHTGLLSQVHTLSSVSGGSLVAIGYALTLKQGRTFQNFYNDICEYLPELNTVEALLENLREREPSVASGSRTLITSLAKVYRDKYFLRYFGDPTFGEFWKEEPEIHLKEIIFNATEFKTGFAFRFQKSEYDCLIGNGKIWLDEKYAREIRMSDIMTASSCIPGGMEPFNFPQDFHWPEDRWRSRGRSTRPYCEKIEADLQKNFGVKSIPLMDGGVYDNQGISSVILALARRYRGRTGSGENSHHDELAGMEPNRPINWARWFLQTMEGASEIDGQKDLGNVDLFIVSDTPTRKDPMYVADPVSYQRHTGFKGFLRRINLGTLSNIGWGMTIILSISFLASLRVFLLGAAAPSGRDSTGILLDAMSATLSLVVPGILVVFTVVVLLGVRLTGVKIAESVVEEMPPMRRSLWAYAKKLRLGNLWDMLTLRIGSLSALASRVYMNRIRQLGYTLLYSHEEFEKRILDNDINTLLAKRNSRIPETIIISDKVDRLIQRAATMRTKLWIDKHDDQRDDLEVMIAAGQITTCFNIMNHLWQCHRDDEGNLHDNVVLLFKQAESDWQKLSENPYLFVDERSLAGRKPGLFWNRPGAYKKKQFPRAQRKNRRARAKLKPAGE